MEKAVEAKVEITGQEPVIEGSANGSASLELKVGEEFDVKAMSTEQVKESTNGNGASEDSAAEEGQVVQAGQPVEMESTDSQEVPIKEGSQLASSAVLQTEEIEAVVPQLEATVVSPDHPEDSEVLVSSDSMVHIAKHEEEIKDQIPIQENLVAGEGQLDQEKPNADEVQTKQQQETDVEHFALRATMQPSIKVEEEFGNLKEETANDEKVANEDRPLQSSGAESPEVQQKPCSSRDPSLTMMEPPEAQQESGEVKGNNTKDLDLEGPMEGVQEEESEGYGEQTAHQEEERVPDEITTGDSSLNVMEPVEAQGQADEMKAIQTEELTDREEQMECQAEGASVQAQNFQEPCRPEEQGMEPKDTHITKETDLASATVEDPDVADEVTASLIQKEEVEELTRDLASNSTMKEETADDEKVANEDRPLQSSGEESPEVQQKLCSSRDSSLTMMEPPEAQQEAGEVKGNNTKDSDLEGPMEGVREEESKGYGEQTAYQEEERVPDEITTGDSSLNVMEPLEVQGQAEEMKASVTRDLDLGDTLKAIQTEELTDREEQMECQAEGAAVQAQNVQEPRSAEERGMEPNDTHITKETDLASATVEHPDVADEVNASLIQKEEVEELTRGLASNSAMEEAEAGVVQTETREDVCPGSLMEKAAFHETTIMELKREISSKDATIMALREEVASKEIAIEAFEGNVAGQETKSDRLNGMAVGHGSVLEEIKEQDAGKEKIIATLEEKILSKGRTLESLKEKVADQESMIVALREKVAEQESIIKALKEKASGQESTIEALMKELTSCKASEEQARKVSEALGHQFSALEGEQQTTKEKLRVVSMQFYKELKNKERITAAKERHEAHILKLQGQLDGVTEEKRALMVNCETMDGQLIDANDMCTAFEEKLRKLDLKLKKTDTLLSQALSEKSEIQEKLKATEELLSTGIVGGTTREMDLKFEELGRLATASDEKVRAQLVMAKLKLVSLQQKKEELEQKLRQAEKDSNEKLLDVEELTKKAAELTSLVKTMEEEKKISQGQIVMSEDEKDRLTSSLDESMKRNAELEEEVESLHREISEQKRHARSTQEMEELVMLAESKRIESENRMAELELHMEATGGQVRELEEALQVGYAQYGSAQEELIGHRGTEEKLSVELQSFRERSARLEQDLHLKIEKNSELEMLLSEERNKLEGKEIELQRAKKDLEESSMKEDELLERLNSAESVSQILDAKLQEALASISEKDSKCTEMQKILENREKEDHEMESSLKAERQVSTMAQAKLKDNINELKAKNQEVDRKLQEASKEKDGLTKMNSDLKQELESNHAKVNELEQKLSSARTEKEAAEETLVFLKDQNSQGLKHLAKAQSQVQDLEAKLEEATLRFQTSESAAQILDEKLKEMQSMLSQKNFDVEKLQKRVADLEDEQEDVAEAAAKVAQMSLKLEESEEVKASHEQKINELNTEVSGLERKLEQSFLQKEKMSEENGKLSRELDFQKTKFNELQHLLDTIKGEHGTSVVDRVAYYEVDSREKDLEFKLQEATMTLEKQEASAKILNQRLEQALEKVSQKDCQAKNLQEKLKSAEGQVVFHQGKEAEAVEAMKSANNELMASTIRRTSLEKIITGLKKKVSETEDRCEELVSEKEAMDEINSKLRSDLDMQQAKVNELQVISASRSEATEVTMGQRSIDRELQERNAGIQDASEAKDDAGGEEIHKLQALISAMKEQLEEYEMENSPADELKSCVVEDELTSEMKTKILELEAELEQAVKSHNIKMNDLRSGFDGEHQEGIEDEKGVLFDQLAFLRKELQTTRVTLEEKEKEGEKKLSLFNESIKDMKQKLSQAAELEKKIENYQREWDQEVNVADPGNKGKVEEKSRGLDIATVPSQLEGKERGHATTVTSTATTGTDRRPSLLKKAFVFIFGMILTVLLSMIGAIIYDEYYR